MYHYIPVGHQDDIRIPSRIDLSYISKLHVHKNTLNGTVLSLFPDRQWTIYEMPNSMRGIQLVI